MPNTSTGSVPFLLSSSMQSIRSRRTSTVLSTGGGSGLLSQLGSGMVRNLPYNPSMSVSGNASPIQQMNGNRTHIRKCPSLNITYSN